jgi:hypothetical protein
LSKSLFTVDAVANEADLIAPTLRDLYRYWQRLRVNGALPHRRAINPADFVPHLGLVNLIDVVDGGRDFRFRLIGSIVDHVLQRSYTGTTVSDYPRRSGREHLMAIFTSATLERQPYVGCGKVTSVNFKEVTYWSVALPLRDDAAVRGRRIVHGSTLLTHAPRLANINKIFTVRISHARHRQEMGQ